MKAALSNGSPRYPCTRGWRDRGWWLEARGLAVLLRALTPLARGRALEGVPLPPQGCQGGTADESDLTALNERNGGTAPSPLPDGRCTSPSTHHADRRTAPGPRGWWARGRPGSPRGFTFAGATETRHVQTHVPGGEQQVMSRERQWPPGGTPRWAPLARGEETVSALTCSGQA